MALPKRSFAAIIALMSWSAISGQFLISIDHSSMTTWELVVRFFSYFTILTNLMVAVCCSSIVLFSQNKIGIFFSKPTTITAVTLYILIVGLVYNVILRPLWQPVGIARVTDEMLHSLIPILVLIFWSKLIDGNVLQWGSVLSWLLYPLIYLLYTLWHGAFSGFYPYPFMDVSVLGINRVLMNSLMITLAFLLIGLLLILIHKRVSKSRQKAYINHI
ncbi:MAG: Pr6Pr family membrane protein [Sphingobacterium sp.]|jgi:hypothetical protein|nr:Pr6Pr family membrane protein [Sphingobacterium sp.]